MFYILVLTQQQPNPGATIMRQITEFLSHLKYLRGIAICKLVMSNQYYYKLQQNKKQLSDLLVDKRQQKQLLRVSLMRFCYINIQQINFRMRSHFAQTLPFHKKDNDFNHNISDQLPKANRSPFDQTTKKSSFYADQSTLKTQIISSYKTYASINDQEMHQKPVSSYRGIQNSNKLNKFNPFMGKEKKPQPPKIQRSPPKPNMTYSPNNLKQSKTMKQVPMRATLKTFLQTKGLTSFDRSFQKNQSRVQSPNIKLNNSISESRCNADTETGCVKSMKLLQKQNKILKEQNELLKCQMSQIKRHIMSANTYKKEEAISNLRDTIKKEDNQIKELRTKLQISNKKVSTLNTLLENRDEEIQFLNNKITNLEEEILELKERNAQKIENLKQKMAIVLKNYTQLQQKFNTDQQQWESFIERWNEQKSMYTHRINFLQTYISNNH